MKCLGASVYHIKRDLNGVAHDSAYQAIRQDVSMPIFSCFSPAHRNVSCPILSVVQQMQFQGVVILAVNCIWAEYKFGVSDALPCSKKKKSLNMLISLMGPLKIQHHNVYWYYEIHGSCIFVKWNPYSPPW
jgi:hypothetical protein